jgi:MFS family permease
LSLFNIAGRFVWASSSDYLGRKLTYYTFFVLGIAMYASAPWSGHAGHIALFVLAFGIILSMYGGGFATVPAYLADMFGTQMVGAIHGRLITAWSAAGLFGPVIVNYMREFQLEHGVPRAQVYDTTAYILCGLLAIGFICNWLVKPVADKHFMTDAELEAERKLAHEAAKAVSVTGRPMGEDRTPAGLVFGAWLFVGIPILWGVWITLEKAWILFK